jgi:DNA repair protein RadC
MPGNDKSTKSAKAAGAAPHYHGHRERLRQRFLQGGSDALQDYELLELILFRAIPRRDVKPLAKGLLKKFGSLAEVIAAPAERLREVDGLGDSAITDLKILHAAAKELLRGAVQQHKCSRRGRTCSTTAARRWVSKARSTSAFCSSTRAIT